MAITLTPATFRQNMPEFVDGSAYPDSMIDFWLNAAANLLNADRWGSNLNLATQLFVAHFLVLGKRNQDAVNAGGNPGELKGPLSARSVDKVANAYDTTAISLTDMGFWGLSSYGLTLFQLIRMAGAGGMQVMGGRPCGGIGPWPGLT